ncbi:MAG: helix-turn-helix domain-containing protein [Hyphomicrobiaceae bacterium]|nr:helix-turn-helix domain-containing protein [Hyphomicrobiaceae bacterium]
MNVAKNLYGFSRLDYLSLNVPVKGWKKKYMHCRHADDALAQCMSDLAADQAVIHGLSATDLKSADGVPLKSWLPEAQLDEGEDGVVFGLRTLHGEFSLAACTWETADAEATGKYEIAVRDLRLLMNYFHGQLLRINGVDTENEILMSARELDCLSWTAAGKTAWEASIILGISERTVRFHLNVAREKLKCATTTQAVAKAISHQLIELSA